MTGTIGGRLFAKRMATGEAVSGSGRPGRRKSGCSRSRYPAIDRAYRRCRRKKAPAPSSRAAWTKLKRDNGMLRRSLNRQTSGGTFSFRTILPWKRRRSTECLLTIRLGGNHHRRTGAGLLGLAGSSRGGVCSRPRYPRAAVATKRPCMQLRPVKKSGERRWQRWPSRRRAGLYPAMERGFPERVRGCPDTGSVAGERLAAAWTCHQRVTPILPSSRRRNAARRRMLRCTAATVRRQST